MSYIDIHSHGPSREDDKIIRISNVVLPNQHIDKQGWYSVAWHPWFISNYSLSEIEKQLNDKTIPSNVIAIGECGIDRAIEIPIEQQKEVFILHLHKAIQLQKPLLIHCVRAYSDIIHLLKKHNIQLPVIFHDYGGNIQQTNQLLKFNSYFSYGDSLIKGSTKTIETFQYIPQNRILLETDESFFSIQKIYLRAAEIRHIHKNDLMIQLSDNFKAIFGDELARQD